MVWLFVLLLLLSVGAGAGSWEGVGWIPAGLRFLVVYKTHAVLRVVGLFRVLRVEMGRMERIWRNQGGIFGIVSVRLHTAHIRTHSGRSACI